MNSKYSLENELAKALFKYSLGNMSFDEAQQKAEVLVPTFIAGCKKYPMLGHKGIRWFAKEVLRAENA